MSQTKVKTASEIEAMRESGRMLATVLAAVKKEVAPGLSTKDLAEVAKRELKKLGGQPPFLGYYGFPDVICISVNDEIVHGIPRRDKIIKDGDIVSLDFGVTYRGMITDSAITVFVGKARNRQEQQLVAVTEASLFAGIETLADGVKVGTIAQAIEDTIKPHKYGIVRELVGHGVGHELHEDPNIPNYGRANTGPMLSAGMTIAIEPMVTLGDHRVAVLEDGWTVVSRDGSRAAHFEHTVLITDEGSEILTTL
jgi:methionyl aminopeptidase